MQRTEKAELINELHEKMSKAQVSIVVGYTGLDAEKTVELRRKFRSGLVDYRVVKNTLATLAAKGTSLEAITDQLTGSNAVIMGYADPVSPAKILQDMLKGLEGKMTVKGAVVGTSKLDAKGVEALAKMPGLNELRASMIGLLQAPASKLARLLNTPAGNVARTVSARADKLGKEAPAAG